MHQSSVLKGATDASGKFGPAQDTMVTFGPGHMSCQQLRPGGMLRLLQCNTLHIIQLLNSMSAVKIFRHLYMYTKLRKRHICSK